MIRDPRVRWPDGLLPEACPVFAHDELEADVSPAAFWARLVRATRWHEDYDNCKRLVIHGGGDQLAPGTRFTWTTFGVRVTTVIDNFEPERYLSWTGRGLGARGHHVWLIEPTPRGCRVVTEETQAGFPARLLAPFLRRGLHHHHPRWLAGLARAAAREATSD
ncbi:MAG TPA: SRPBCC family protein [Kofleriaceae bacterium]|nr:SRPBCC family protein [Kofleriaceae bacterium]